MDKIKIFITDDHALFRQGVAGSLQSHPTFDITGEAKSIEEMLSSKQFGHSDILILDVSLKEQSSLKSLPTITSRYPELKIIMLSMHNKPMLIKKTINLGVSGYVLKDSPPERLVQAVKEVQADRKYLDPGLSDSLFKVICEQGPEADSDSLYNTLSSREQEIFRMLAEGESPAQISKKLCISRKTVENHRSKIISKLRLNSPAEIIQLAEKLGVL